ncbi:hypothetical protein F4780DRAFT_767864 [Xylariomycetidae sp. FL0641]|nr:hypothetical protein F4780DRAFT_767864 [Xylariomycetidae sp. FL0641]
MTRNDRLKITSNWTTLEEKPLTNETLEDLFANRIPCVRHKGFLSHDECSRLVKIAKEMKFGHYDPVLIFPLLSTSGITQFDYSHDMDKYLSLVEPARALQKRFIHEAGVDVIGRVRDLIHDVTGLPVRLAREGDREYFAGILRVVEGNFIAPHADYGPFSDQQYEIGKVVGQVTWNILLENVPGGETLVHDRPWQGKPDDEMFQKERPQYAYRPHIYDGTITKVISPVEGDLTLFNSRNFHEVLRVDEWYGKTTRDMRCTISCFIGLLPEDAGGPCLVLWS